MNQIKDRMINDQLFDKLFSLIETCSFMNGKEKAAIIYTLYAGMGALSKWRIASFVIHPRRLNGSLNKLELFYLETKMNSNRNNMKDIVILIAAMHDNLEDMKKRLKELELIVKWLNARFVVCLFK